jgi:hypothetical protein
MTGKIMQQNLLKNAIAASLILVGKPCGKSMYGLWTWRLNHAQR